MFTGEETTKATKEISQSLEQTYRPTTYMFGTCPCQVQEEAGDTELGRFCLPGLGTACSCMVRTHQCHQEGLKVLQTSHPETYNCTIFQCQGHKETADTEMGRDPLPYLRTAVSLSSLSPAQSSCKMNITNDETPPNPELST